MDNQIHRSQIAISCLLFGGKADMMFALTQS